MTPILVPAYAPPISYMAWMLGQEKISWVTDSHYKKQTYRNRAYIYGANGRLTLTVPILHTHQQAHQKENKVQTDPNTHWQKLHWKSLEAAYRSSPFFEFYEADFYPLYHQSQPNLYAFNRNLLNTITDLLELNIEQEEVSFDAEGHQLTENWLNAKKPDIVFAPYTQVFQNKYGFLTDLSVLDLLFNLGPESLMYLRECQSQFNPNST